MDNLFDVEFDLNQVATASGAKPVTIKSWIAADKVVASGPTAKLSGGGGSGKRRGFGFRSVIEIGFAKAILNGGINDLDSAFGGAMHFAHTSEEHEGSRRVPGFPYPPVGSLAPRSLLFIAGDQSRVTAWTPGRDGLTAALSSFADPEVLVTINCNAVFDRIVAGLGLDRGEVMRAAYGEGGS